ncbi:MAG: hypothetical protein JNL60_13295 [Bacteroidia bacterium]|nr:hypothetical protein [Bacteroidia bacterium]
MRFLLKVLIVLVPFLPQIVLCQADSTQLKDSLRIYKKIKNFAGERKFTRWIYEAVFVDPEPKEYPRQPAGRQNKNVNPYLKHSGKIIREINITVYDPFGHSVNDTLLHNINGMQRFGNHLHIKTKQWIVFNRLLFEKGKQLDPLQLSETERLLRTTTFINDARITITPLGKTDSVDINVVVQDKWPLTIPFLVTDVYTSARLRNQNLFGWGQQFEHYTRYRYNGTYDFDGFYRISNLDNTYISATIGYNYDVIKGTQVDISFDRPFFSPLSVWAGGFSTARQWRYFDYLDPDSLERRTSLQIMGYDAWLGRSFKLSRSRSLFSQSTNIVAGLRHFKSWYPERPPGSIDTMRVNEGQTAVLGNIGLAVQQYYKDSYIYRFGITEDVPEGLIIQATYGVLQKEFKKLRYYSGIEIARAQHLKIGYLSATAAYGVYYNRGLSNDITTQLKLYYFSNLAKSGRWYFRQFIDYTLVHGENKFNGERLTIGSGELYDYDGTLLSGNTKMLLNAETVCYLPYNLIGFKFAPVAMIGLGMLGDKENPLLESRLYQSYSLALMVRNENLLSSTFQVSIGLYPFTPQNDSFSVLYNPVTSFTLRVRPFIASRPEFITY